MQLSHPSKTATDQAKVLGLIAGNGKFPLLFAQKAKSQGYKVIIVGVKKDTSFLARFLADAIIYLNPGELRQLFVFFKAHHVQDVIMAGQIHPRNLFLKHRQRDEEFDELFRVIEDRKTDTIFAAVADRLAEHGMRLQDSTFLIKDHLAPKGTLTKRGPSEKELMDIDFGRGIAKAMGEIDVGQTVVIKDKAIVAIEAMEGTDQCILRGGHISREGAVVVKMSKPQQDFRFDVPVVGPRTIKHMVRCKARCLAIEAGKTILIDRLKMVQLANRNNICIVCA